MIKIILDERALDGSFEEDEILSSSRLTENAFRILGKAKKGTVFPAFRTAKMQREERDWVFDLSAAYQPGILEDGKRNDLVRIIRKSGARPDKHGKVCVVDIPFSENLTDAETDRFSMYQSFIERKTRNI